MVKGSMQGNHLEVVEKEVMVLTKASISLQEQESEAIRTHAKPTLKDKQINLTPDSSKESSSVKSRRVKLLLA